jgi:two-component system nitrate/nitrite response regulator NarL
LAAGLRRDVNWHETTFSPKRPVVSAVSYRSASQPPGQLEVGLASLRSGDLATKLGAVALRCLIVDDSIEFAEAASRRLESEGLSVVGRATSASEAISVAESVRPDVALVDVQLGEESGVEVARLLTAHVPAPRVILISAHSREELVELLTDDSAVLFLPKTAISAAAIANCLR